jgi:hypothetical protein
MLSKREFKRRVKEAELAKKAHLSSADVSSLYMQYSLACRLSYVGNKVLDKVLRDVAEGSSGFTIQIAVWDWALGGLDGTKHGRQAISNTLKLLVSAGLLSRAKTPKGRALRFTLNHRKLHYADTHNQ